MRVVPGLIKDGEVQVFIEVQEEPDTLEIAGFEKAEEADADEEAGDESATDADAEGEEGHDKEDEEDDEEDEDEEGDEDEGSTGRLEAVADAVAAVCGTLYQRLQEKLDEDEAPSEFRIEFGITLAGGIGIPVVSQGDTAASFKVTVKWENS